MAKSSLLIISSSMIVAGFLFYIAGHRKRNSLDISLLSNHAKIFIGSTLIVFGLVLLTSAVAFK
jgi:hypothetical protein